MYARSGAVAWDLSASAFCAAAYAATPLAEFIGALTCGP